MAGEKYYDKDRKEDKHFFAGLLNTAEHNLKLSLKYVKEKGTLPRNKKSEVVKDICSLLKSEVVKDICSLLKSEVVKDICSLLNSEELSISDLEKNVELLSNSFTFIKYLKNQQGDDRKKEIKEIKETLIKFCEAISELRNFYTHYERKNKFKGFKFDRLDDLILRSALNLKAESKSKEYLKYLKNKYNEDFKKILCESKKKLIEKNKRDGKKYRIEKQDEEKHVLNRVYDNFICKKKTNGSVEYELRYTSKEKEGELLSYNGFIQLLCLFLNKKQTEILFSKTKYFKGASSLEHFTKRRVFSFMCYKNVSQFFRSEYSQDALLLQMVEELKRCPKALYRNLDDDKKQEFIEDINEYYKDNNEDLSLEQARVSHEVKQVRSSEDKFPYFTIRFLDDICKFENLKFHINLGKFNHGTAKKEVGKNLYTERKILEKISIFENLSKATKLKKEYFKKEENKDLKEDWVEFPNPSYLFNGNSIGIWLKNIKELGNKKSQFKRKNDKTSKFDAAKKFELAKSVKSPVAFLSFNELPALLHALLVEKKSTDCIEEIIKEKIIEQQGKIQDFTPNSTNDKRVIPKKMKLAKEKEMIDWKRLESAIAYEIEINPLKEIRKNYKNPTKYPNNLSKTEKGKIATWLAKDIKRFTSKETRKKWKGYQYAELQTFLSYLSKNNKSNQEDLTYFLKNDLNFGFSKDNPFGGVFFNQNTNCLYDFYTCYLKKRKKYLEKFKNNALKTKNKAQVEEKIFVAFNKRRYIIKSLEKQKSILSEHPVNLPKGVFDKTEYISPEEAQKFYSFITKEKIKKEIGKDKWIIGKSMRNDFYILEMVKYIFRENKKLDNSELEKFSLKNTFLKKEERRKEEGDDSSLLETKVEFSILKGKIKEKIALKKIGKYKKLEIDQRVEKLVNYFPDKIWSFEKIDKEIESYDKIRRYEIFKEVHKLEEHIYKKASEEKKEELSNNKHKFREYLKYYYTENSKKDCKDIIEILREIRNRFAHNQLPCKDFFEKNIKPVNEYKGGIIANYLLDTFTNLSKKLK